MYTFDSRVRYSEIGEDQKLTLYSLVNYFQDCSTFQSESTSRGFQAQKEAGRAWILASWQICVNRYPNLGEQIRVSTWPYAFRGFQGSRNYQMTTSEGEILAYANSLWVYVDVEKGNMVRIPKEEADAYELEEKLDMEYAPRRINLPESKTSKESFTVRKSHLDTNHHVNNAQYIRLAREYVPKEFQENQIRVEYKKQAVRGDEIFPEVAIENGVCVVALCDSQENPYAIVEFTGFVDAKGERK